MMVTQNGGQVNDAGEPSFVKHQIQLK